MSDEWDVGGSEEAAEDNHREKSPSPEVATKGRGGKALVKQKLKGKAKAKGGAKATAKAAPNPNKCFADSCLAKKKSNSKFCGPHN